MKSLIDLPKSCSKHIICSKRTGKGIMMNLRENLVKFSQNKLHALPSRSFFSKPTDKVKNVSKPNILNIC